MKHLFKIMKKELSSGHDLVMATIVDSSGSTPRGAGSRMIVGKNGLLAGTIGGGNVEYRSIQIAAQILSEQTSCEHSFQLNKTDISDLGMVCGGEVNVFFHFLSHKDFSILNLINRAQELFRQKMDFWLISDLTNTGRLFLYSPKEGTLSFEENSIKLPNFVTSMCASKPLRLKELNYDYFVEQIGFSETVYIFGGGHVSQSLVPALAAVNFSCVVLDDRKEFTDRNLFPDAAETILCDFHHLEKHVTITAQDFCCVMTRGHSYDTDVQAFLLKTPARYIGVIGSRRKKAAVFQRLIEEFHIPEEALNRIISPIGIDIKAETPAEIAVSITAQLILARAK